MEETQEIWKPIKGFEGLYEVSNLGRVKALTRTIRSKRNYVRTHKGVMLRQQIECNGYYRVRLSKNSKAFRFVTHRLVAIAFIPNPHNYPQINHKDENKLNNHVDNLEWCTPKYNINYGTGIKRRASKRGKKVLCVETGKIYNSQVEAAKELNLQRKLVNRSCRFPHRKTGGFHFRNLEE